MALRCREKRHRHVDPSPRDAYLKKQLEEIRDGDEVPFPSMAEVSIRLETNESVLRLKFKVLCKEISARYLKYNSKRARSRVKRERHLMWTMVCELHERGIYPSHRNIAANFPDFRPALLRLSHVRNARRRAIKRLGLPILGRGQRYGRLAK